MIYTDIAAVIGALMQLDENDAEGRAEISRLMRVYHHALTNPPDGVIGVGAITYAEDQLIAAQMETTNG